MQTNIFVVLSFRYYDWKRHPKWPWNLRNRFVDFGRCRLFYFESRNVNWFKSCKIYGQSCKSYRGGWEYFWLWLNIYKFKSRIHKYRETSLDFGNNCSYWCEYCSWAAWAGRHDCMYDRKWKIGKSISETET